MTKPRFTTDDTLDAMQAKAQRETEERENLIRLEKDGDLVEVPLDSKQIEATKVDFGNGLRDQLRFHFQDQYGSWKHMQFSPKWGLELRALLKDAGGSAKVRIVRKGQTKEETSYDFKVVG